MQNEYLNRVVWGSGSGNRLQSQAVQNDGPCLCFFNHNEEQVDGELRKIHNWKELAVVIAVVSKVVGEGRCWHVNARVVKAGSGDVEALNEECPIACSRGLIESKSPDSLCYS